jgi:hypothetical protein
MRGRRTEQAQQTEENRHTRLQLFHDDAPIAFVRS